MQHQDVFIVNRNFLTELLEVFEDKSIGLIGMVGAPQLPEHAVMWYGERVGRIYTSNVVKAGMSVMGGTGICEVEAVDKKWRHNMMCRGGKICLPDGIFTMFPSHLSFAGRDTGWWFRQWKSPGASMMTAF